MVPAIAESSSISARRYSSSSRRKTSRSLWGELAGGWADKSLPGARMIRLRSRAAMLRPVLWTLLFDFNSAPEGYMVLHVTGCRLGIRIVPGGILIFLSVD